jgi:adenylosuccinate synthase
MLLDVPGGLDELKICTAYDVDGTQTSQFPSHVDELKKAKPVYETLPGWREDLSTVRSYDALPATAKAYLARIGELLGRPVLIVSVGPDREQTIFCDRTAHEQKPWPRPQHRTPANA